MRLIDADELKKALGITNEDCNKCGWGSYESCGRGKEFEDICIAIDNAVTVDAVPVIRCKDCYHGSLQSNETKTYHCLKHNAMMEGHWFCNLGEREPPRQKYLICRKCGYGWFGKYNFCPHCGADIRKDGDS